MNFRVLGCSGSESDRNHPCSFQIGSNTIVDMGSAASRLALPEQVAVRDVFLSHAHLDHTKDLAFFAENVINHMTHPTVVRGTSDTLEKLGRHLLNNELWPDFTRLPDKARSVLRFEPFEERKSFSAAGLEVMAIPVNHPGGCVAYLFQSPTGVIVYSGDTGPTDEIWEEVNRRGAGVKAILLECSFPNRLQSLADASGHHTPATFEKEIRKIKSSAVSIYVYHLKAPYLYDTLRDIQAIGDPRVRILEAGMTIEF